MASKKHTIGALDAGQLDRMFDFLILRNEPCYKQDVRELKVFLDKIRQAMIQKNAGQRKTSPAEYVNYDEIGTYVNLVVVSAMTLYVFGGLNKLEEILPERGCDND